MRAPSCRSQMDAILSCEICTTWLCTHSPGQAVQHILVLSMHVPYVCRYSVMLTKCWDMDPDTRASFSQVKSILEDLQSTTEENPPMDLHYELQQQARGEQQQGQSCMTVVISHWSLLEWTYLFVSRVSDLTTMTGTCSLSQSVFLSLSSLCTPFAWFCRGVPSCTTH